MAVRRILGDELWIYRVCFCPKRGTPGLLNMRRPNARIGCYHRDRE